MTKFYYANKILILQTNNAQNVTANTKDKIFSVDCNIKINYTKTLEHNSRQV